MKKKFSCIYISVACIFIGINYNVYMLCVCMCAVCSVSQWQLHTSIYHLLQQFLLLLLTLLVHTTTQCFVVSSNNNLCRAYKKPFIYQINIIKILIKNNAETITTGNLIIQQQCSRQKGWKTLLQCSSGAHQIHWWERQNFRKHREQQNDCRHERQELGQFHYLEKIPEFQRIWTKSTKNQTSHQ